MTRRKKITGCFVAALAIVGFSVVAMPVIAQTFDINQGIVGNLSPECRNNGNCGFCDFIDLFVVLQKVILSLFGGLAIIMLIWGGQGLITAAGSSEKIAGAKKLIASTIIGVLLILAGYFLITVLIGILTSPTGGTFQSNIFGSQAWQNASCGAPNSANYCKERSEGASCIVSDGGPGKCKDKTCVSACEYDHSSWTCKPIGSCVNSVIQPATTNDAKLRLCTEANECQTGLCGGGIYNVCCK